MTYSIMAIPSDKCDNILTIMTIPNKYQNKSYFEMTIYGEQMKLEITTTNTGIRDVSWMSKNWKCLSVDCKCLSSNLHGF